MNLFKFTIKIELYNKYNTYKYKLYNKPLIYIKFEKMSFYKIIQSNSINQLEKTINEHITQGYEPLGGLCFSNGGTNSFYYQQAIILNKEYIKSNLSNKQQTAIKTNANNSNNSNVPFQNNIFEKDGNGTECKQS